MKVNEGNLKTITPQDRKRANMGDNEYGYQDQAGRRSKEQKLCLADKRTIVQVDSLQHHSLDKRNVRIED